MLSEVSVVGVASSAIVSILLVSSLDSSFVLVSSWLAPSAPSDTTVASGELSSPSALELSPDISSDSEVESLNSSLLSSTPTLNQELSTTYYI